MQSYLENNEIINKKIKDVEDSISRSLQSSARLLSEVGSGSVRSGGLKGVRLDRARASSQPARLGGQEEEYEEDDFEEYYEEDFEVPEGEVADHADAVDGLQGLQVRETDPRNAQILENAAQPTLSNQAAAQAAPTTKMHQPLVAHESNEGVLDTGTTS